MDVALVTGASGFLGSNVASVAASDFEVVATSLNPVEIESCRVEKLDVTDKKDCIKLIQTHRPDVVVHSAAVIAAKVCEENSDLARAVNVEGTRNVVMACERIGAKLIYVSTDWVFDGEKELGEKYREGDQAGPVNMYGRTKLEGEHIVQSSGLDWIIARAAHIYGCNQATPKGKGALRLHLEKRGGWAYNSVQFLRSGGEIRQPSNMWQTPTLASEFAEFILELHRKAARGIFHVCGNDCISRLAFARELARIFQLDLSLVKEGSVKDLSRSFGISETGLDEFRVPRNVCLDNRKLVSTSGRQPVSLVQGIGIMKLQSINLEHGLAFD